MCKPLLTISAGRTRDLAGWHSQHLAEVLAGRAPARRGPRSPAFFIDLDEVGAVVLWTKQPAALLESPEMGRLLPGLRERGILVVIQLSVTGLGGSPLEPGIPDPFEVADTFEQLLGRGLLAGADCVKLRWDPVAVYELGPFELGNATEELFLPVFERFRQLGAVTWTSSVLDLKYRGASGRLNEAGIRVADHPAEWYRPFYAMMDRTVAAAGGHFSLCCSPPLDPWVFGDGCIDGDWINRLRRTWFGRTAPPVETMRHNEKYKGGQRPRCGCSHSVDISYSTGFRTCATQYEDGGRGGCCLYCYSWHGRTGAATNRRVKAMLERLRSGALPEVEAFWQRGLRRMESGDGH